MDTQKALVTTVVRNPIKEATRLARQVGRVEVSNLPREKQKTRRTLTVIRELEENLLPIEHGLLPAIKAKKGELIKRKKQLGAFDLLRDYSIFSLEPLTWRSKQGYPLLAVFSIKSPKFELAIIGSHDSWDSRRTWRQKITPDLPKDIVACYQDVLDKLKTDAKEAKKTIRLSADFAMLIPQPVKDKIASVRSQFKEIFVVAEAPKWHLKQTAIRKKDPIVVGWDDTNYWLITTFDPTPLEEYIAEGAAIELK